MEQLDVNSYLWHLNILRWADHVDAINFKHWKQLIWDAYVWLAGFVRVHETQYLVWVIFMGKQNWLNSPTSSLLSRPPSFGSCQENEGNHGPKEAVIWSPYPLHCLESVCFLSRPKGGLNNTLLFTSALDCVLTYYKLTCRGYLQFISIWILLSCLKARTLSNEKTARIKWEYDRLQ